jgi:hypothetical protein
MGTARPSLVIPGSRDELGLSPLTIISFISSDSTNFIKGSSAVTLPNGTKSEMYNGKNPDADTLNQFFKKASLTATAHTLKPPFDQSELASARVFISSSVDADTMYQVVDRVSAFGDPPNRIEWIPAELWIAGSESEKIFDLLRFLQSYGLINPIIFFLATDPNIEEYNSIDLGVKQIKAQLPKNEKDLIRLIHNIGFLLDKNQAWEIGKTLLELLQTELGMAFGSLKDYPDGSKPLSI